MWLCMLRAIYCAILYGLGVVGCFFAFVCVRCYCVVLDVCLRVACLCLLVEGECVLCLCLTVWCCIVCVCAMCRASVLVA